MTILALVPEAEGGHGGIATYNRDLINALCALPRVSGVKLLPRHLRRSSGCFPAKVHTAKAAARGLVAYAYELVKESKERYDAILCSHIYLLPFASLARGLRRIPIVGVIYGVEAWQPTGRLFVDRLSRKCDGLISISEFTRTRFQEWSCIPESRVSVLPNAVHASAYGMGPKPDYLVERYGLQGRRVILTLGRLSASERQKGVDELIDLMPRLISQMPDLVFLVGGDGDDRPRLQRKVSAAGLEASVRFLEYVKEAEKADHYRLCDVFSMAGRQEGFGFVFLEAMATGAPVVASELDGSRNAVLEGKIGELANPDDPESLRAAIIRALGRPRNIPELLGHFSFEKFVERLDRIMGRFISPSGIHFSIS